MIELNYVEDAFQLIASHPLLKGGRFAYQTASVLLMWEYSGKVRSIRRRNTFIKENSTKKADNYCRFVTREMLFRFDKLQDIFLATEPNRYANNPTKIFMLDRFWSHVIATFKVSKTAQKKVPVWLDDFFRKQERDFFNGYRFEKRFAILTSAFITVFPLPLKGERYQFNKEEEYQTAQKTHYYCQWAYPNGQICPYYLPKGVGQMDHIKEYSKGGKTDLGNARWICPLRNQSRGAKCMYDDITP